MLRHPGANMETVRRKNRASILKFMNDYGLVSRKDLAEMTGLTPAAVTQICTDLLNEGVLIETGMNVQQRGAGRKKALLDLNYRVFYVYAVTIEPQNTTIAISDLKGEQIAFRRLKTEHGIPAEQYLQKIAEICRNLQQENNIRPEKITAAGVGITGIVDKEKGSSKRAYGIWQEEVPVAEILSGLLHIPVYVENNVNAFALAELFYGAGKEHDNLMVIKWGPGVGCAMIIDQQIYEGRHSKAAELGHFIVEKNGEKCKCGRRGCLETKVSYEALCKIHPFEAPHFGVVFREAAGTETGAEFEKVMDIFAQSIVNSATIMAPNRIILTGELFRDAIIREALIAACMSYDEGWGSSRILYSSLSEKESYIGAVAVCAKILLFS